MRKIFILLSIALFTISLVGCKASKYKYGSTEGEANSTIMILAEEKVKEMEANGELGDPKLMYHSECPECGGEYTCPDDWCLENEEDYQAYLKHQEEYRKKKAQQDIKDTCAYCGYKTTGRKTVVRPYTLSNGEVIYLCNESYSCISKYKAENGLE